MKNRYRLGLLVLSALVLPVALTWPLAADLSGQLVVSSSHPDVQCGLWWPGAFAQSLFSFENPFMRNEFNFPDGQDTRLLLWNYAPQLLFAPITAFVDPVSGLNLMMLGIMTLNGLCAAGVVWGLTRSWQGAVAALVFGVSSAFAVGEAGTGRPEQALWGPVGVYIASLAALRRFPGSRKWVVTAGVSLAVSGAIYWFYAYFLVVLTICFSGFWALRGRMGLRDLVGVAAISGVVVAPFLAPVILGVLQQPDFFGTVVAWRGDPVGEQMANSLVIPDALLGSVLQRQGHGSEVLPILTFPLGLWALLRGDAGIRAAACVLLAASILCLGPVLQHGDHNLVLIGGSAIGLPYRILDIFPGFERLWWPYRWAGVAVAALSVLVGWLASRMSWRWVMVLLLLVSIDGGFSMRGGMRNARPIVRKDRVPVALMDLAKVPDEHPILQFPIGQGRIGWQPFHQQPIDTGLAWSLSPSRPSGYAQRQENVLLWQLLGQIQRGESVSPISGLWSEEDTGGFHYVMAMPAIHGPEMWWVEEQINQLLGEPFFRHPHLVIWAIEGLGEVPPGYSTSGDGSRLNPGSG